MDKPRVIREDLLDRQPAGEGRYRRAYPVVLLALVTVALALESLVADWGNGLVRTLALVAICGTVAVIAVVGVCLRRGIRV